MQPTIFLQKVYLSSLQDNKNWQIWALFALVKDKILSGFSLNSCAPGSRYCSRSALAVWAPTFTNKFTPISRDVMPGKICKKIEVEQQKKWKVICTWGGGADEVYSIPFCIRHLILWECYKEQLIKFQGQSRSGIFFTLPSDSTVNLLIFMR